MTSEKKYFSLETGILGAKSDAHHDFGKIYNEKYVNLELPSHDTSLKYMSEDQFMRKYIVNNINDIKVEKTSQLNTFLKIDSNVLNDKIKDEYTIVKYRNNKSKEDEEAKETKETNKTNKTSKLQEVMDGYGIIDDIFIICDVAYSWIKKDLTNVNKNKDQIFWWTQTIQTGFDPAGKTAWHTGKDIGFKEPWTPGGFRFCWQSVTTSDKPNKIYTPWPENELLIGSQEESSMLCLNKQLLMTTKADSKNLWNYQKHDSYLLIYDVNNSKYVYASKEMAAKNYKMSKGIFASYKNFASKLVETCKNILNNDYSTLKLDSYTLQYQMLAKRCGDMPQALACLNNNTRYQTLIDPSQPPSQTNVGIPPNFGNKRKVLLDGVGGIFESNGNNMFVSYDRIAVAQAINYRVPLVFYDQPFGFVLFINNKLLSPIKKLDNLLVATSVDDSEKISFTDKKESDKKIYFKYGTTKELNNLLIETKIKEVENSLRGLKQNNNINDIKNTIQNELLNLSITNDNELRVFLKAYFTNLVKMDLLNNTYQEIININATINDINNEFKNLYKDASIEGTLINNNDEINTQYLINIIRAIFEKYTSDSPDSKLNINEKDDIEEKNELWEAARILLNMKTTQQGGEKVIDELKISDFASDLSTITGFVLKTFDRLNNLYKEYEKLNKIKDDNTISKGINDNIDSIKPSEFKELRLSRRDPESQIYSLTEQIIQYEKVINPIWKSISKLNNNILDVSSNFSNKLTTYITQLLNSSEIQQYIIYKIVVEKANEDLNKLFYQNNQVGGEDRKRKRDVSDAFDMFEEMDIEIDNNNIDNLIEFVKTTNNNPNNIYNLINFDTLLKNIFNILTFYYIDNIIHDKSILMDDIYRKIGKYLKINESNLSDYDEGSSVNENLYLFNALENQVYYCPITYEYNGNKYNFAKIFYYYLNQVDKKGLVLYPELNDVVLNFDKELYKYIEELDKINYELISSIMDEHIENINIPIIQQPRKIRKVARPLSSDQIILPREIAVGVGGNKKSIKVKRKRKYTKKQNKQKKILIKRKLKRTQREKIKKKKKTLKRKPLKKN